MKKKKKTRTNSTQKQQPAFSRHLQELNRKRKNANEWTLDDWVLKFHEIYSQRNHDKSPIELWLHVANDAGQLSEEVRKGYPEEVVVRAAKLFGRICAFVGKYLYQKTFDKKDPVATLLRKPEPSDEDFITGKESYSKWILMKYTGRCQVCGRDICLCPPYRTITENRDKPEYEKEAGDLKKRAIQETVKAIRKKNRAVIVPFPAEKKIVTVKFAQFKDLRLDNTIDYFHRIYGGGQFDVDLWKIAAHLMEEIGEVSNEILYLQELKERERHRAYEGFDGCLKKIYGDKGGKEGRLAQQVKMEIARACNNEEKALRYVKGCIRRTLKEELADVFSWLSALLWKIGETWRHMERRPLGTIEQYFFFWEYLYKQFNTHPEPDKGIWGCSFCASLNCQIRCRTQSLMSHVIDQRNKREDLRISIVEVVRQKKSTG